MARITSFVWAEQSDGRPQPTSVDCAWRVFGAGSARILQLDTFGSNDRANPGKQSQTLQLDRSVAEDLIRIIQSAFPKAGAG